MTPADLRNRLPAYWQVSKTIGGYRCVGECGLSIDLSGHRWTLLFPDSDVIATGHGSEYAGDAWPEDAALKSALAYCKGLRERLRYLGDR